MDHSVRLNKKFVGTNKHLGLDFLNDIPALQNQKIFTRDDAKSGRQNRKGSL